MIYGTKKIRPFNVLNNEFFSESGDYLYILGYRVGKSQARYWAGKRADYDYDNDKVIIYYSNNDNEDFVVLRNHCCASFCVEDLFE